MERDRISRELRAAEMSAGELRESLERVAAPRAEHAEHRVQLANERMEQQQALGRERAVARRTDAHGLSHRNRGAAQAAAQPERSRQGWPHVRLLQLFRSRARRSDRAHQLSTSSASRPWKTELEAEDQQLAALEERRRSELERLEQAREKRGAVLASLQTDSRARAQNLERLKRQQSGLEKLLRELKRAIERFPADSNDDFARLRGKLAWPVSGRLTARFGQSRAGGVKWDGVMVATDRGTDVRAVSQGRVVYADWLPGLGLLTIVDHGEGYLSLYGHNDRLYKAVGERVSTGEPIAAAGDTGGRSRPELYFEIRKGGKPIDPAPWFRASPALS